MIAEPAIVAHEIALRLLVRQSQFAHADLSLLRGLPLIDGRFRAEAVRASEGRVEDRVLAEEGVLVSTELRTDVIDIYQVHWPDPNVPIEETAGALLDIMEAGKIRAIGVSNFSPAQMDKFRSVAPLHTNQPPYNLFEREIEKDVLAYCQKNSIMTLAYGALCRGLLAGKISDVTKFTGDDLRRSDPKFQQPRFGQYLKAVAALDAFAKTHYGKSVVHLAVRWILDKQGAGFALWGARRPDQLDPIDDVYGWTLDGAAMAEIDKILIDNVKDPVGPEFMAPPERAAA